MVDQARNLAAAVSIPLIADADTGYGSALQVRRTVQQYEAAGVAALHIEDQVAPKRCGHLAGKQVVPAEEFVGRIRAAVEARTDPDLLVIARTDAIAVTGFDDAVGRAEAAARAGADVLFVEAPTSEAEIEALPRRLDRPLLFNYAPSGRSPLPPFARLRALGYAIVILRWISCSSRRGDAARARRPPRPGCDAPAERLVSFQEFCDLIGLAGGTSGSASDTEARAAARPVVPPRPVAPHARIGGRAGSLAGRDRASRKVPSTPFGKKNTTRMNRTPK
jgi:hypothetical protein